MKKQLSKLYAEVYELEHDSGFLCKTRGGTWVVCDPTGNVIYGKQ